ncbi:hypothetical protein [Blastomonas fulva]|jgi:selenocysteine lyase/cysteine desulfurase|uniref:hypothetical protein n=1 Tax=Blastomonas fulva TaxID=1550728 RepID=UPI003D294165
MMSIGRSSIWMRPIMARCQRHRVLVGAKSGLASGPILRVTPALFNTTDEIDQLVAAIRYERAMFAD